MAVTGEEHFGNRYVREIKAGEPSGPVCSYWSESRHQSTDWCLCGASAARAQAEAH